VNIENCNKAIYLISNAPTMNKIFHPERYKANKLKKHKEVQDGISILGPGNSMQRSTNIFLEYMMVAEQHLPKNDDNFLPSRENIIEKLRKRREILLQFNTVDQSFEEILKRCKNNCTPCSEKQKNHCKELKRVVIRWNKLYNDRISMSILANRAPSLQSFILNEEKAIEPGIQSIVTFLSGENPEFEELVAIKRQELDNANKDILKILAEQMIDLTVNVHEDLIYRIKPLRRIPFQISFENSKIKAKLDDVEEYISSEIKKESEQLKSHSKDILTLTKDESIGPERHLLQAILNYNSFNFD
jgi:hypothetical protein